MQTIILAGGFGIRLKSVVQNVPKPMAPINNKPFLQYLLDYLVAQEITGITFSLFYQHEIIMNYFGNSYKKAMLNYIIDAAPFGTGGAIKNTIKNLNTENIFIINGDTFLEVDYKKMYAEHVRSHADITIATKKIYNTDRFGTIEINTNSLIKKFSPPQKIESSDINAGVYLVNVKRLKKLLDAMPEKFSFENDFLTTNIDAMQIYAFKTDGFFIDIGVPEDYEKFCIMHLHS